MRAYFVDLATAAQVAAPYGYSAATVHQMAHELRAGKTERFRSSRPGPKGPRKATRIRDWVLALRAQDRSVSESAAALTAEGTPVSAQTVWTVLAKEGLERLPCRTPADRGAPPWRAPVKYRPLRD